MRRAAVSIPSNISEGAARGGTKEFIQFLYVALGSLSELETQVIIAKKLSYINNNKCLGNIELLRKKLLMAVIFNSSPIIFLSKLSFINEALSLFEISYVPYSVVEEILLKKDKSSRTCIKLLESKRLVKIKAKSRRLFTALMKDKAKIIIVDALKYVSNENNLKGLDCKFVKRGK